MNDFAPGYGPLTYKGVKAETAIHMSAVQTEEDATTVAFAIARITGTNMQDMRGLTGPGKRLVGQVRRALNELTDEGMLVKSDGFRYGRGRAAGYITKSRHEEIEREKEAERERSGVGHAAYVSGWSGVVVGRSSPDTVVLEYQLRAGVPFRVTMPAELVTIARRS